MAIKINNTTVIDDSRNWTGNGLSGSAIEYGGSQTYQSLAGMIGYTDFSISGSTPQDTATLTNTLAIIVYGNKIRVVTRSGNDISYGTPVTISSMLASQGQKNIVALDSTRALLCYHDNNAGFSVARVLTVSGSTISVGTAYTFYNGVAQYITLCKIDTDKSIVYFVGTAGSAIVLTTSGSVVTVGSINTSGIGFSSGNLSITALSPTTAVISYEGANAAVLTVSGNTITSGTATKYSAGTGYKGRVHKVSSTSVIAIYNENNYTMCAVILNVSGTNVSVSTQSRFSFNKNLVSNNYFTSIPNGTSGTSFAVLANVDEPETNANVLQLNFLNVSTGIISYSGSYSFEEIGSYTSFDAFEADKLLISYATSSTASYVLTTRLFLQESLALTSTSPQYLRITKNNAYNRVTLPNASSVTGGYGRFIIENTGDSDVFVIAPNGNFNRVEPFDVLICSPVNNNWSYFTLQRRTDALPGIKTTISATAINNFRTTHITEISTNKALLVYKHSGSGLRAVVLSVSGTTITTGTPIDMSNLFGTPDYVKVNKLSTDKVLLVNLNATDPSVAARVLTISGTTITEGTPVYVSFGNSVTKVDSSVFDSSFAIAYYERNDPGWGSNRTFAKVLSISGSTISLGAESSAIDSSGSYNGFSVVAVNSTTAITFDYSGTPGSKILTRSGTTITVGDDYRHTNNSRIYCTTKLSNDRALLCYFAYNAGFFTLYAKVVAFVNGNLVIGPVYTIPLPGQVYNSNAYVNTIDANSAYVGYSYYPAQGSVYVHYATIVSIANNFDITFSKEPILIMNETSNILENAATALDSKKVLYATSSNSWGAFAITVDVRSKTI
jgi:hypothetical protein